MEAGEKKRLSEGQVEFVSYVEQVFWETGYIPTIDKIEETLQIPQSSIKRYWEEAHVREHLAARGVNLIEGKTNELLTPQQLQLANMLLNVHDKQSVREKLQACGVSSQQYNAWLRTNAFQNYLRIRAEAMFAASDHVALQSLVDTMASGDTSALKLYFEMRGRYNPRLRVDVNLEMVLTRVLEVIQTHVKDPAILTAIANDLSSMDEVGSGGVTPAVVPGPIEARVLPSLPPGADFTL